MTITDEQHCYAETIRNRSGRLEPTSSADSEREEQISSRDATNSLHSLSVDKSRFTSAYDILPPGLQVLAGAVNYGLPPTYQVLIDDKPEWLDLDKFKLGQEFAMKYLFSLMVSELLSLIMCSLIQDNLRTLMYNGKSSTPFTSYKRYLSTVLRVQSWFENNIWDKKSTGYKNLLEVREVHLKISKKINSESENSLKEKLMKEDVLWCPLFYDLRDDFRTLRSEFDYTPDSFRDPKIHINQCDMSLTQFCFFGLMIVYPQKFGVHRASREELDGLVHVWRVLGYYLGIDEKFNFCQGSIDDVQGRCRDVISFWFRPSFSNITQEWEHMCRCLTEGVSYYIRGVSFEVMLLYLCWVLGITAPKLYASLTLWQRVMFIVVKISMCFALRMPGTRALLNLLLRRSLKTAQNMSPEKLKIFQKKVHNCHSGKTSF